MVQAAVVACSVALFMTTSAYVVPSIEYPSEKAALAQSELQFLQYALEVDGIVALTSIPGLSEIRNDCLVTLGKCYELGLLREDKTLKVVLADGTTRVTLAMNHEELLHNQVEDYGCPGLGKKMSALQAVVDDAAQVFAKAMDATVLVKEQQPLFMAVDNPSFRSYHNFSSVIDHGDHLDHFHVYEKPDGKDNILGEQEALERHTDQGLFVAIIPSISVKNGKPVSVNDGFEIELPLPKGLTRLTLPNDGDAVLFMLGDGISNWIDKRAVRSLRAVPHRLVMQQTGIARAWFGRMFFPPKDAFIQKQRTTFEKLRMESVEHGASNVDYGGCSNRHHVLRDLTESGCGVNEIYCWMACRSTSGLHCTGNQTIECVDQRDGQIWTNEGEHCFDCAASCYGTPTNNDNNNGSNVDPTAAPGTAPSSSFCNMKAYPTNMYMDGFNGLGPDVPCLIFLFQSWVLDTQVKYAFGSIGAFLVGLFIEFIILLRRQTKLPKVVRSKAFWCLPDANHEKTQSLFLITLYAVQLVFAYFAMLLAMSFAVVIFTMVMLGLVVGHFAFNSDTPAGGNEACCAANEEEFTPGRIGNEPKPANCCSGGGDGDGGSAPYHAESSHSPEPINTLTASLV